MDDRIVYGLCYGNHELMKLYLIQVEHAVDLVKKRLNFGNLFRVAPEGQTEYVLFSFQNVFLESEIDIHSHVSQCARCSVRLAATLVPTLDPELAI